MKLRAKRFAQQTTRSRFYSKQMTNGGEGTEGRCHPTSEFLSIRDEYYTMFVGKTTGGWALQQGNTRTNPNSSPMQYERSYKTESCDSIKDCMGIIPRQNPRAEVKLEALLFCPHPTLHAVVVQSACSAACKSASQVIPSPRAVATGRNIKYTVLSK